LDFLHHTFDLEREVRTAGRTEFELVKSTDLFQDVVDTLFVDLTNYWVKAAGYLGLISWCIYVGTEGTSYECSAKILFD